MSDTQPYFDDVPSFSSKSDKSIRRMSEISEMSDSDKDRKKIIYPEMSNRRAVNNFRDLRNALIEKAKGENLIVMVSSVLEGGGASLVAVNLAAAFAFDQNRTSLLIDTNLSAPGLDTFFDIEGMSGVVDYIEGAQVDIEEIIYASGIKRMRVLPAGQRTEYASEYLGSSKMEVMFESLKKRYNDRFIIVDAPPLTDPASARQIAKLSDKIVIVVPYGKINTQQLAEKLALLPREKLAGVLINDEPVIRQ